MFIWCHHFVFLWGVWLYMLSTGFTGECFSGSCLRSSYDQVGVKGKGPDHSFILEMRGRRLRGELAARPKVSGPGSAQCSFCYMVRDRFLTKIKKDRGLLTDRLHCQVIVTAPPKSKAILFTVHVWHHLAQSGYLSNCPLWQRALKIIPPKDTTKEKTKWFNTNIKNSRTSNTTTNKILKTHNN